MKHPTYTPVTLDDLQRDGKFLWVYCNACGRDRDLDPLALPLPGTTPVPTIGKRMKCSACGSKSIHTAPELYPQNRTQRANSNSDI